MATVYTEPTGEDIVPRGILKRVSWGAIFAGTVVALVISLALSLLGMAIGLGTINPATEENPLGGFRIGAGIWMALTTLISLFVGGWTASKLAGYTRSLIGILHGVVVWGLVTLFSFYLMTSTIGMLVSGVGNIVGKGISMIGSGITAMAPEAGARGGGGGPLENIMSQARDLFSQRGAAIDQETQEALKRLMTAETVTEQDRTQVVTLLTERTDMSREDAEKAVDGWLRAKTEGPAAAARISEQAMDTLATAALWSFIAMVLGAIAAAIGGAVGAPKKEAIATARH